MIEFGALGGTRIVRKFQWNAGIPHLLINHCQGLNFVNRREQWFEKFVTEIYEL